MTKEIFLKAISRIRFDIKENGDGDPCYFNENGKFVPVDELIYLLEENKDYTVVFERIDAEYAKSEIEILKKRLNEEIEKANKWKAESEKWEFAFSKVINRVMDLLNKNC